MDKFTLAGITLGDLLLRIWQHTWVSLVVVVLAAVIALPLGVALGHSGKGAGLVSAVSGAFRALPTLGLLTIFGLMLGIGLGAPLLALGILAFPSLLAGAYSGMHTVDRDTIDAAYAQGFTVRQVLCFVELPLAFPIILGGIRTAALQVVATTTLAAYTADIGLGRFIFHGLKTRDYYEMLVGSVAVIILALLFDALFVLLARLRHHR